MNKKQIDSVATYDVFRSHFPLVNDKGFCDSCMKTPIKTSLSYGLSGDLYCYLCDECFAVYNKENIFILCKGCGAHLLGGFGLPLDSIISKQLMYCKHCRNSLMLEEAQATTDKVMKNVKKTMEQLGKIDFKKKHE